MKSYATSDEYFAAVRSLADQLQHCGQAAAAAEVQSGFACLNGMTDGWVDLMDSLMAVEKRYGPSLPADLRDDLASTLQFARKAVSRS